MTDTNNDLDSIEREAIAESEQSLSRAHKRMRRGGGRPPEAEEARMVVLRVRLTQAERDAIDAMQINFAALVRSLARSYTPSKKDLPKAS